MYEYCLGFEAKGFHVDSRSNLFFRMFVFVSCCLCQQIFLVKSDLHTLFDTKKWILLPSITTLEEVDSHIEAVISARNDGRPAPTFRSKVSLASTGIYIVVKIAYLSGL